MKNKYCNLLCVAALLTLPAVTQAANISVDSTTIFRMMQRDLPGDKQDLMPATQFLTLDLEKLADGNLSLHLSGWGRLDLAERSYNDDHADGSLTYGYLRYRFNKANADIRAGRFFVNEGVVHEQVDGVSARTDLPLGFSVSAFGGATVHSENLFGEGSDGKGDTLFGGRASYRYRGLLELGVSGVYEDNAPPLQKYVNGNHRLVGGDLWFSPLRQLEVIGHTSYNPESRRVAEHSYLVNIKPVRRFVLSGEYNENREQSYLYAWTLFSGAALNPAEKSRSLGGSAAYEFGGKGEVAVDYKHYKRDQGRAERYGANLKLAFLGNSLRSGFGYHYLRAGRDFAIGANPGASYHELRAYALHDTKSYFASIDVIDYLFKEKLYDRRNLWEAIFSLGYHITPDLALSGDVSYGRNLEFTSETKGLIRLTYNLLSAGRGGK